VVPNYGQQREGGILVEILKVLLVLYEKVAVQGEGFTTA